LREILFFAECAKAVANNHGGIIPFEVLEGKQPGLFIPSLAHPQWALLG